MGKSDKRIELEHSIMKSFPLIYGNIKMIENRVNIQKGEVRLADISCLNILINSIQKDFTELRKIPYQEK